MRGAQCLAALRRWQLEHDEPPPDLETLVRAAGMDRAPTDPWTGQPLRMKTIEDELVIYSIGPDREDGNRDEWRPVFPIPQSCG